MVTETEGAPVGGGISNAGGQADPAAAPPEDTGSTEGETDAKGSTLLGGKQDDTSKAAEGAEGEKKEGEEADKGDGKDSKDSEKPEGAPEKYEFKAPEGYEGELDQKALEAFEPIARELGLNQEQAQKLVDIQAEAMQRAQQEQRDQLAQISERWVGELKNDPDFGGAKFDQNIKTAQVAMSRYGSPELTEALEVSGLGNNPALVKFMAKVGSALGEDTVHGNETGGGRRGGSPLFPTMESN